MENNNIIEETFEIPQEETRSVKIAPDVVASIANVSAKEIKGFVGMCTGFAGGIAEILGAKKSLTKGIKVEIDGNSVVIDMSIIVEFGVKIPDLAALIQENVKNNVETMTGLEVLKVNISVDGISFKNVNDEDKQVTEFDDEDDVIIEEAELEELPESDEV